MQKVGDTAVLWVYVVCASGGGGCFGYWKAVWQAGMAGATVTMFRPRPRRLVTVCQEE
jgi:hypothetical protein